MSDEQISSGRDEKTPEMQNPDTVTAAFENRQEDLMAAIEVIDLKNKEGTRRTIHIMAVLLVGYWSVETIVQEPGFAWGWVLLLLTVALGVFVWREPRAGNLRYTARYVERAPQGCVTADSAGFTFEDGTGRESYRHADGVKLYEYKNILALDGGKKRFAQIPLDQLDEAQRESLLRLARAGNFERVEPKQAGAGLFRKKSL